jgi:hypothetical protein
MSDGLLLDGGPITVGEDMLTVGGDPLTLRAGESGGAAADGRWKRLNTSRRIAVVREIAPHTMGLVSQLICDVERDRGNSPEFEEALSALRELHWTLGELLDAAEAGKPLTVELTRLEQMEGHLNRVLCNAAVIGKHLALSSFLCIGISALLGLPIDGSLAGGVFQGVVVGGFLSRSKGG